jgi:cytochrome c oxidase assembly factor CtaG
MTMFLLSFPFILAHGVESHDDAVHVVVHPQNVHELWTTWGWEPYVWIGLALAAFLYVRGLRRMWREPGAGHGVKSWEAWCYAGGWFALFVALVSPLHPWGAVLLSAHMTQHEILMLVAAPLVVLGRPILVYLHALPRDWAAGLGRASNHPAWRSTWGAISNPLAAFLIHSVLLWVWHAPALFNATLSSEVVHTLQHLSFLAPALLFWWALIHHGPSAIGYGIAVLYLFLIALHSQLLGVLMTFASTNWYVGYATRTQSWGLTPLEDQQLAGLIMWIPAGVVYIIAALALMAGWLRESELRAIRREQSGYAATTEVAS